jgi:CRP-like cAMP-binding protein
MLKSKMRKYDDNLKRFVKNQLRTVPYIKPLCEETIEEISYYVNHEYYENNQIVFRAGDPVTKIYFVTMGEVDLFQEINDDEFIIDTLYQGCWIGAYKALTGDKHIFTMRAGSDTTLHYLSRDSISVIMNDCPDFAKESISTHRYMKWTRDPIVDFN